MKKNSYKTLFLLIIFSAVSTIIGYSQNFKVVTIDEAPAAQGPEELSVAISKKDPSIVLVGANVNRLYTSHDTGSTWKNQNITSRFGVWGDPCIINGKGNNFYYFHLSDPTGLNWRSEEILDRIVSQRVKRKGTRLSKAASIGFNHPKDQDKEWAVADLENKKVYCVWTQFDKYGSEDPKDETNILFSTSNLKANKWSTPLALNAIPGNCADDDRTAESAYPAVGPNGELHVVWSYDERIYLNSSLDFGNTWMEKPKIIAPQIGGWTQDIPGIMRANGMPNLLSDKKSGTLYLIYTDQRNGANNTDVYISISTNQGVSWSESAQINQDKTQSHQFFAASAIDETNGTLYVIYYDRSKQKGRATDVTLSYSTDKGKTWKSQIISESPFEPTEDVFFGDYISIAAHNDIVRPVWTDLRKGKLSVKMALIDGKSLRRE